MTWREWLDALAQIATDARSYDGNNGAEVSAELTIDPPGPPLLRLPSPYDQLFDLTSGAYLVVTADGRSGSGHQLELHIRVEELPDEPSKVSIWHSEPGGDDRGVLDLETGELECRLDRSSSEVFYQAAEFASWFIDYWGALIRDSLGDLVVRG